MSKTGKIIITVIASVVVLEALVCFFVPRLLIFSAVQLLLPAVGEEAVYCTDYESLNEDVQTIENGYFSIDIPADYEKREFEDGNVLDVQLYYNADKTYTVMLGSPDDWSDMNLFDPENYESLIPDPYAAIGKWQLQKGFEDMGNGLPDSGYNTYKCIALLGTEDYSFWNFRQGVAFLITGVLKNIQFTSETEIYENGETCALINFYPLDHEEGKVKAALNIYSADDLNTETTLIVAAPDRESVYEILNSVTFLQ